MRSAKELDRLGLLVPELLDRATPDAQTYALAYVERYQGDVLQLEHEWAFLSAALTLAWQREAYAVVVTLVAGLAHVAGRLSDLAEAEAALRLGIEASRRTQDWSHLATFSNRLSGLLFARGNYQESWPLWNSGLELAQNTASPGLWEPLSSFAYITDVYLATMLGLSSIAPRFMQTIQSACRGDDPDSFIVAHFVRGFYQRLTDHQDSAYDTLSNCLRSVALQASGAPPAPQLQLLTLVVQAELARAQQDYARSQAYTQTALALAQVFSDPYTVAALLIDQGLYTYKEGQLADLRATYLRLRMLACQVESPRVEYYNRLFARLLAGCASELSPAPLEPMSEREREVLELVAAGHSNQQIARRLVITPATVKKHLEHIYTKLDVHSRTAALARARDLNLL